MSIIQREDFILIDQFDETYACKICLDLAINPQECILCEQLFCNDCLLSWKQKNDKCPNQCEGTFQYKQAHRLIRNEIAKFKCYCKNKAFGCNNIIPFETIPQHLQNCEFKPVSCCSQCPWQGIEKALQSHKNDCEFITDYQCENCRLLIQKVNRQTHNCFQELLQQFNQLKTNFEDYKQQTDSKIYQMSQIMTSSQINDNNKVQSEIINVVDNQFQQKQQKQKETIVSDQQQQQQKQQIQQLQYFEKQIATKIIPNKVKEEFIKTGQLTQPTPALLCNKQHMLQFWSNPGLNDSIQYCQKCMVKSVCRYICVQCKAYFCLKCAPPQLKYTQNKRVPSHCPAGHEITSRKGPGYVCDICSRDSQELEHKTALQCRQCDFDICEDCLRKYKIVQPDCKIF